MPEIDMIQEIRERLIRIETKLENSTEKHSELEKRVSKLEDNISWIVKAILTQIIIAVMAFIIIKR